MPIVVNGRPLGVARNGVFTDANTDPIPGGRLWPEAALTWNAMRAAYVADGGHPDDFEPAGPRSSARSLPAQRDFYAHQPPPAAYPGTSNHGWAIAVDVKTRAAAAWLMRHAHEFGWSHDEGARVGEWWHFRYIGATRALRRQLAAGADALAHYTGAEKRWIREYDHLAARHLDAARRRVLRRVMTRQRKEIWRQAQRTGWDRLNRKRRYRSLRARTT